MDRSTGTLILINTKSNYRKWPRRNHNLNVKYGHKFGKTWYRGSVVKNNILTIQQTDPADKKTAKFKKTIKLIRL